MIMGRHSDKIYKVQIDFVYHESCSTVYLDSAQGVKSRGYEYGRHTHDDVEFLSHIGASARNNLVKHFRENNGMQIARVRVRAKPKLLFKYQFRSSLTEQEKVLLKEVELFWKLVNDVIEQVKIENKGFRIITNSGSDGNQDVPHFHVHILGGRNLGRMIN